MRPMRSRCFALLVALAAAGVAGAPVRAAAQEIPAAKVAIFDPQRVLRESAAAIDIRAQIDRQRQIYREAITKQEQDLRATDQELSRQRTILAPDAFATKRREFDARVARVQREVQRRARELDQAYDFGIKQVRQVLATIIDELSKERGFTLVLSRRQVIYADDSLDISGEVLVRLNQRLLTVEVPLANN